MSTPTNSHAFHLMGSTCPNDDVECLLTSLQVRYGTLSIRTLEAAQMQLQVDILEGKTVDQATTTYVRTRAIPGHFSWPAKMTLQGHRLLEKLPSIAHVDVYERTRAHHKHTEGSYEHLASQVKALLTPTTTREALGAIEGNIEELDGRIKDLEAKLTAAKLSAKKQ